MTIVPCKVGQVTGTNKLNTHTHV